MKKTLIFPLLFMAAGLAWPAEMPKNAHARVFAAGWECDEGFYLKGEECLRVAVPEHGRLNLLGDGWLCETGYARTGDRCEAIRVPDNAQLDPFGKGWNCFPGFYKDGEKCLPIPVPPNAKLDDLGKDWECIPGFKKNDQVCMEMSLMEKADQEKYLRKLAAQDVARGPEGTACHAAYNKCTSACYEPVYDRVTSQVLKNSDFVSNCSSACSQGSARCESEPAETQCAQFGRFCRENCPDLVHELGASVGDTNARSVCEKACAYGMGRCVYHARHVLPAASL